MNASKKFIVWDWNGTLLDDSAAVLTATNNLLKHLDTAPLSMDVFRDIQTWPLQKFYRNAGVPEEKIGIALENNIAFHDDYERRADHVSLRTGAADILAALKACNVGNIILSNHIEPQIARLLRLHKIDAHFDGVLANESAEKQFKDITKGERLRRHIASQGLTPANALIVGDTEEEIHIARAVGMESVAITGGMHSEARLCAQKPDYLVHDLPEMLPLLRKRGFVA